MYYFVLKLLKFIPLLLFVALSSSAAPVQKQESTVPKVQESNVEDLDLGFSIQINAPKSFETRMVKEAITLAYVIYEDAFGDEKEELKNALNYLVLVWKPDSWALKNATIYSVDGKKAGHSKVVGLTTSPFVIEVSAKNDKICETSLVHELVHVFLWHSGGDPDPDHEGKKYHGWTEEHTQYIQLTNELICILEGPILDLNQIPF